MHFLFHLFAFSQDIHNYVGQEKAKRWGKKGAKSKLFKFRERLLEAVDEFHFVLLVAAEGADVFIEGD